MAYSCDQSPASEEAGLFSCPTWRSLSLPRNRSPEALPYVFHPQRNAPEVTTPKTKAGTRSIPLIEPLQKVLSPFEESGFIIGGENPLTASAYRAMWKRITKTIDMHGATPHVLRHSYLTYAVGATTDFKTIQGISGHADVFTLLNTYAHSQDDKVLELSEKMAEILTKM